MALQPKNNAAPLRSRALRAGLLAAVGFALASCAARPVAWHSPGEASQLDSSPAVVFEGEQVLAARADADPPEYAWADPSLNIRTPDSQWQDAMWPQRTYRRGWYHRFTLPRSADTILIYQQDTYSSSTQYRTDVNRSYRNDRRW